MWKPTPQKKPAAAATSLRKRPAIAALCVRNTRTTGRASQPSCLLDELKRLGREPKRKHEPQGQAEIAENNLAIRLWRRMKKSKPGQDTEIKHFLQTCPKSSSNTDQTMMQLRELGHPPKRIKKPRSEADVKQNLLARKMASMRKNAEQPQRQQNHLTHKETDKETQALSTVTTTMTKTQPELSQPKKRVLTFRHTV